MKKDFLLPYFTIGSELQMDRLDIRTFPLGFKPN